MQQEPISASGWAGGPFNNDEALSIQSTETPALASPYLDPFSVGCWYRLGDEGGDYEVVEQGQAAELGGDEEQQQQQQQQRRRGGGGRNGNEQRLWPCQRSLHAAAVQGDAMFVFGGYDGSNRVNDLWAFSFLSRKWSRLLPGPASHPPPSPRDRHVTVVHRRSLYVFGGFDGNSRVNDFMEFRLEEREWRPVVALTGSAPTPRHSHTGVVYKDKLYIFSGYDGSYRNDFNAFDFATAAWAPVPSAGKVPKPRYRATCCVKGDNLICFGGHDGTRHLNDINLYEFSTHRWATLEAEGIPPLPRDSHTAVVHHESLIVFGGSTGNAMDDMWELNLEEEKRWRHIQPSPQQQQHPSSPSSPSGLFGTRSSSSSLAGPPIHPPAPVPSSINTNHRRLPGARFCHVAVVWRHSLFIFGGYDGSARLGDLLEFKFGPGLIVCGQLPESTLVEDLRGFVNQEALSDVTFVVGGGQRRVHAHKVLCLRSPYFRALFVSSEMRESREREVVLEEIRYEVLLDVLTYLYTDAVRIDLGNSFELFQAADRFGIERLKRLAEHSLLASISIQNAAALLLAADTHNAVGLRAKVLSFVLRHFDAVSKTHSFEEMARANVDLALEVLRKR